MTEKQKPGFLYQGIWITNPTLSECCRFTVDPVKYYGQVYLDWLSLKEETRG